MVYVQPPSHGNGSTPPFTPLGTYSGLPLRSVCINIKRQSRNANIFTKILIYPGITWSGGESDPPEWIGYVIYATGMLDLDGRTSVCWIDLPMHRITQSSHPSIQTLSSRYFTFEIKPYQQSPGIETTCTLNPDPKPPDNTGSIPSRIQARRSRRWRCRKVCVDDPVYPGTCESLPEFGFLFGCGS
jgi:hypothetical protein